MFKISEIFYSIQGEGYWTGTPAIFVRFSGCNLRCLFCDTKHESYTLMSIEEILKTIDSYAVKVPVILTGGEPLFQLKAGLGELICAVSGMQYPIHIETNGTFHFPDNLFDLCWITVSPKEHEVVKQVLKKGNEIKLVYSNQNLSKYEVMNFEHYYLQPESMKNTLEVVEICKRRPLWKLSLQTQKLINIA